MYCTHTLHLHIPTAQIPARPLQAAPPLRPPPASFYPPTKFCLRIIKSSCLKTIKKITSTSTSPTTNTTIPHTRRKEYDLPPTLSLPPPPPPLPPLLLLPHVPPTHPHTSAKAASIKTPGKPSQYGNNAPPLSKQSGTIQAPSSSEKLGVGKVHRYRSSYSMRGFVLLSLLLVVLLLQARAHLPLPLPQQETSRKSTNVN